MIFEEFTNTVGLNILNLNIAVNNKLDSGKEINYKSGKYKYFFPGDTVKLKYGEIVTDESILGSYNFKGNYWDECDSIEEKVLFNSLVEHETYLLNEIYDFVVTKELFDIKDSFDESQMDILFRKCDSWVANISSLSRVDDRIYNLLFKDEYFQVTSYEKDEEIVTKSYTFGNSNDSKWFFTELFGPESINLTHEL